jgi:hypothetical protein
MAMVNEISHLQEIIDHLSSLAADPDSLPELSEQVIKDVKGAASITYKPKVCNNNTIAQQRRAEQLLLLSLLLLLILRLL